MVVVDSSVLLDYLVGGGERVAWVERTFDEFAWNLHAPHLVDVEVAAVLRRLAAQKRLDPAGAAATLTVLQHFRLVRYPHTGLLGRIWELRHTVTTYDAAYVALAEALDAPLLTTDGRLARASGPRVDVLTP